MAVSPLMNMDLPDVSTTLGPAWATKLYNALYSVVDSHNHASGNGQLVPSAGIDIDADLDFGNNDATSLRTVRFRTQTAALAAASDLRCLYAVGSELYYNDGNGTAVAITLNGAVTGASGTIAGLPSGTASAAFATVAFTFRSATNVAALMDVGPVYIRDTAVSAKFIALKSPVSLAADYDITLPAALPNATKFMRMTTAGVLSADVAPDASSLEVASGVLQVKALGIATAMIAATAVTRAKMEAVGYDTVDGISFDTTSQTYTDVTGLTVDVVVTTTGRPIIFACYPTGALSGNNSGYWYCPVYRAVDYQQSGFSAKVNVTGALTASVGQIRVYNFENSDPLSGASGFAGQRSCLWAPGILSGMFVPASAGTYTLQVQMKIDVGAGAVQGGCVSMALYAYQL